jgi:hypothetical protein
MFIPDQPSCSKIQELIIFLKKETFSEGHTSQKFEVYPVAGVFVF